MATLREWMTRLLGTLHLKRSDPELEEELRLHLELATEDARRQTGSPDAGARAANRESGGVAQAMDALRDQRGVPWLNDVVQDVRYALRTMTRNRAFAATALLTLALGIGMTTAVFSVVYSVLLKPLPYPAADRLVRVWQEFPGGTPITTDRWISTRTFYAWMEHPRTVDVLGGSGTYEYTVAVHDDARSMFGESISPQLLRALGPRVIVGRLFSIAEAEKGADRAALLGERLWREAFGGDPHVIGRSILINEEPHTIVGVVAADFSFPDRRARFWLPYVIAREAELGRRTGGLTAIGRLAPGATIPQLEAEGTAAARSVPILPSTLLVFGSGGPPLVHATPLAADMTASVRPALLVLVAAVACILLIACANVAGMLLSRGVARQRELAVRAAIGAGRARLVRQLFTEAALFSIAGGLGGVVFAWTVIRALPAIAPVQFPRLDDVHVDARVLIVAIVAAFVATIVSGLAPAIRGAHFDVPESLHGGDGPIAGGFRGLRARRMRDLLLAAEAAFAVLLLIGAGLLAHSFVRLTHVDAGYTADHVLTARVQMPRNAPPERTAAFTDSLLARLRALPDVRAAGAGNMMPLFSMTAMMTFALPPAAGGGAPMQTRQMIYAVTPGYAESIGLRLREGRFFDERDMGSASRLMIVNDEFVRRYSPNTPIVGRRIRNLFQADRDLDTEIVGVVGTVLKDGNDRRPEPEVYTVRKANRGIGGDGASINFVIRTAADPSAVAAAVRTMIRDIDRTATIEQIEPLADQVSASVAQPRFATTVLIVFAATALALASIGLYGVLSYAVSQRRRELGLRAALGASRVRLLALVMREGLSVTLIGLAIGLAAALACTRFMQSALFGVTPLDAASFAAAPAILAIAAVGSCLWPASRAASADPAEALRCE